MTQLDFLALGDLVVDDFIRLKDASVHCNINNENCEICMRWGDKIPFEFAVRIPGVGNGPNAAVAAARLGLNTGLRAYVGQDEHGKACIDALTKDKVDVSFVVQEAGKNTNYHYVLWYEDNRTILVKHEEFSYSVPDMPMGPKYMYLTSLAQNSLPYHQALAAWLAQHPETKLAFQPGTFQMTLGAEALKDIYAHTEIFFCNKEEAERILNLPVGQNPKDLLLAIQKLGPKHVVITNDRAGAYALSATGEMWMVPMYPQPPAYEKTGAGDSFASSITAALALGLPLQEALMWGPVNAMCVVAKVGAQEGLLTREQLQKLLDNKPAEFALSAL
jgi:ribokinase